MKMQDQFSDEIKSVFYSIYNNDQGNLKYVPEELMKHGLGYMQILMLTKTELNLGLGEAMMLLEIPDCTV
ncbi:hypothetical protein A4H97_33435 [Niastella yeongjuensis]|uniref:Uncharacterized protein n=1 Tax=Niastella yeongjuensis TaxID=354355 RepID=A0A1V9EDR5_9BACT|nr:hypothetical protein [Niastella yeongjuensis]OQP44258.1 hypothetical protein A4H97_33435 [Niastella yeongjuensis]SEO41467.1 hypothetical protein SAMN05660816_02861 [Niastella yeongjuensis]